MRMYVYPIRLVQDFTHTKNVSLILISTQMSLNFNQI